MRVVRGWHKVEPGESLFWNCNKPVKVACCDCGLVHKYVIKPKMVKGYIAVKAYRDNRATARFRKKK